MSQSHSQQQQTTNDYLQKTDTYRLITRPVFVQPNLSQGYYYPDFDKASATTVVCDSPDSLQDETGYQQRF